MWSRISNLAQSVQGMVNTSLREDEEAEFTGVVSDQSFNSSQINDPYQQSSDYYINNSNQTGSSSYPTTYEDMQAYIVEQQQQLTMLKEFLRERDDALMQKDKQLQDLNTRHSRLKLQSKSQAMHFNKQLEEANRVASDVLERSSIASDESICTISSEVSTTSAMDPNSSTFRAKLQVARRRIEELERKVTDLDARHAMGGHEIQQVLADKDELVQNLTKQVQELSIKLEEIQRNRQHVRPPDTDANIDAKLETMLTQMMVKDQRLLELNNVIMEHERTIIDLREHLSEKQQVIETRSKVVQLMQKTLRDREQTVRDQEALITKLVAANEKLKDGTSENQKIEEMQRFFESVDKSRAEVTSLKEQLLERDQRLAEQNKEIAVLHDKLKTSVPSNSKSIKEDENVQNENSFSVKEATPSEGGKAVDNVKAAEAKFVKFKAQAAAKIKALESEVARLKQSSGDTSALVTLRDEIIQLQQLKGHLEIEVNELQKKTSVQQSALQNENNSEGQSVYLMSDDSHQPASKLAETQETITRLESQLSVEQQEKLRLADELSAKENNVRLLHNDLITLEKRLQDSENSCADAMQKFNECELKLRSEINMVQQLENDNKLLVEEIKILEDANKQLIVDYDKLRTDSANESSKAKEKIKSLVEQLTDTEGEISRLNEANAAQMSDMEKKLLRVSEERENFAISLKERTVSFLSELEEKERNIASLRQQLSEISEKLKQTETDWEKQKTIWDECENNLHSSISSLQSKLADSNKTVKNLSAEKNRLEEEIFNFRESLALEKVRLLERDASLAMIQQELDSMMKMKEIAVSKETNTEPDESEDSEKKIALLNAEIQKLQEEVELYSVDREALSNKLQETKYNQESLQQHILFVQNEKEEITLKLLEKKEELSKLSDVVDSLQKQIDDHQKENLQLTSRLQEKEGEQYNIIHSLQVQNESLQNENAGLSTKLLELECKHSGMVAEAKSLRVELEHCQTAAHDKVTELEERLNEKEKLLKELEFSSHSKQVSFELLRDQLSMVTDERDASANCYNEIERELRAAQEQVRQLTEQLKLVTQMLDDERELSHSVSAHSSEMIKVLQKEKSDILLELKEKDELVVVMTASKEALLGELNKLEEAHQCLLKEFDILKHDKEELSTANCELQPFKEKLSLAEAEVEKISQQNIAMQRNLTDQSQYIEQLKENLEKYEIDYKNLDMDRTILLNKIEVLLTEKETIVVENLNDKKELREQISVLEQKYVSQMNCCEQLQQDVDMNIRQIDSLNSSIATYNAEIESLQLKISNLTEELNAARDRNMKLEAELVVLNQEVNNLKKELHDKIMLSEAKGIELNSLQEFMEDLKNKFALANNENDYLKEQIAILGEKKQIEIQELVQSLNALQETHDAIVMKYEHAEEIKVKKDAEICKLVNLKSELENMISQSAGASEQFKEMLEKKNYEIATLQSELSTAESFLLNKNEEVSEFKKCISDITSENELKSKRLCDALEHSKELEAMICNLQTSEQQANSSIVEMKVVNENLLKQLEAMEVKIQEFSNENSILRFKCAELSCEIEKSYTNLKLEEEKRCDLELQCANLERNCQDISRELENEKAVTCTLQVEHDKLYQTNKLLVEQSEKRSEDINAANKIIACEVEDLKRENCQLQEELAREKTESESKNSALSEELTYLRQVMNVLKEQCEQLGKQLSKLEAENENYNTTVAFLQSKVTSAEDAFESTKNTLNSLQVELVNKESIISELEHKLDMERENFSETIKTHAAEIDMLKADCNDKKEKLSVIAASLQEEEELLIRKTEEVEEKETEMQHLQRRLTDMENSIVGKDSCIEKMQLFVDQQNKRLNELEESVGDKVERINSLASKLSEQDLELEQMKKDAEEKDKQLKKCSALIKKFKTQVIDITESKEMEIARFKSQEEAFTGKYTEIVEEKNKLCDRVAVLEEQIAQLHKESEQEVLKVNDLTMQEQTNKTFIVEETIKAQSSLPIFGENERTSLLPVDGIQLEQLDALEAELIPKDGELRVAYGLISERDMVITELKNQVTELQEEINVKLRDIETLNNIVRQEKNEKDQVTVNLMQQVVDLQEAISVKLQDIENLNSIVAQEKIEKDQVISDLNNQVTKLQEEINAKLLEIEKLNTKLLDIENLNNVLEQEENKKNIIIADLKSQVTEVQQEIGAKLEDIEKLNYTVSLEREQHESSCREMRDVINEQKHLAQVLQVNIDELKAENNRLQAEVVKYNTLASDSTRSTSVQAQNNVSPGDHKRQNADAEKLAMKLEVSETKNAKMLTKLRQFKEKNDELQKKVSELETLGNNHSQKPVAADASVITDFEEESMLDLREKIQLITMLEEKLADVNSKFAEREAYINELEFQSHRLSSDLNDLQNKLNTVELEFCNYRENSTKSMNDILQEKLTLVNKVSVFEGELKKEATLCENADQDTEANMEVCKLEKENKLLEKRLNEELESTCAIQDELDKIRKKLKDMESKQHEKESIYRESEEKQQNLLNKLELADQKLEENEQKLARYQATVKELETALRQVRGSSPQLVRNMPHSQSDASSSFTLENKQLRQQLDELQEKYAELEAEYQGTTEEMQLEIARKQQTVDELENNIRLLQDKLNHSCEQIIPSSPKKHKEVEQQSPKRHKEVEQLLKRQVEQLQKCAVTDGPRTVFHKAESASVSTMTGMKGCDFDNIMHEVTALKEMNHSAAEESKQRLQALHESKNELEKRSREVERLKSELERLKQELVEERKNFDQQRNQLVRESNALHTRCSNLEEQINEIENLQDRVVETSALNAHMQHNLQELQSKYEALLSEKSEMELTMKETNADKQKKEIENENTLKKLNEILKTNHLLEQKISELNNEKTKLNQQIETLHLDVSELQTVQYALDVATEKNSKLAAECKSYQQKLVSSEVLVKELQHFESECSNLNSEVTRVLKDNTALVGKVNELYDQLKVAEKSVLEQTEAHALTSEELQVVKSEKSRLEADKLRLNVELAEVVKVCNDLQANIDISNEELQRERNNKVNKENENAQLKSNLDDVTNTLSTCNAEINSLREQLQTCLDENMKLKDYATSLESKESETSSMLVDLNNKLEHMKHEKAIIEERWEMAKRDIQALHTEANRLRLLEEEHERDRRYISERLQRESGEHIADKESLAVELEEATLALQQRDEKLRLINAKLTEYETRQRHDAELLVQTEETKASVLQQLDKEKDLLRSEKTNLLKLQEILSQKEKENAELLRNLHSRQQKVVSLERELEQIKARNENEDVNHLPVSVHKPVSPSSSVQENIHLIKRLHDVEQTHKAAINQLQQLEQQMALEKEQRSHLEDALAHTEELLKLREYRNSVNDLEAGISSEHRPLLLAETTLVRQWQSYVTRLRRWVTHSSFLSHRRPRIRTQAIIVAYAVLLHVYVIFGCLLGLF